VSNHGSGSQVHQLKVARVWGFGNTNDASNPGSSVYYQVLNSSGQYLNCDPNTGIASSPIYFPRPFLTDFPGIGRLDYVVSAAEAKGVKLVLPLLNNYNDLGGINVYNTAFGSTPVSFYTDAASQAACKLSNSNFPSPRFLCRCRVIAGVP